MEDMSIGFDEIAEAFIEMIEVLSNAESDEERWPHVNGFDPDAVDDGPTSGHKRQDSWRSWVPLVTVTSRSPRRWT
jgi:hypothetical protein